MFLPTRLSTLKTYTNILSHTVPLTVPYRFLSAHSYLAVRNMSTKQTFTLNDGSRIPWLGFGTGTALFGKDATNAIRIAIDNGITHLDGAQMYGNESSLGAGIRASGKPRSDLYVVTKLHNLSPGQTVKQSLEESLRKLGLDYVDLFLIHSPSPANRDGTLKDIWQGMEEAHKAGLARSIGVSNHQVEDLKTILDSGSVVPAVNQVSTVCKGTPMTDVDQREQIELHPYVWKAAEPIVKFDQENGIVTASYGGQTPLVRAAGGPLDAVLHSICERLEETRGHLVTTGQVLSKWILQKGAIVVTCVSIKSYDRVLAINPCA